MGQGMEVLKSIHRCLELLFSSTALVLGSQHCCRMSLPSYWSALPFLRIQTLTFSIL